MDLNDARSAGFPIEAQAAPQFIREAESRTGVADGQINLRSDHCALYRQCPPNKNVESLSSS